MCKTKMNKKLFKPICFRYSKQYRLVWALADRLYVDGHFHMIGHLISTSEMECNMVIVCCSYFTKVTGCRQLTGWTQIMSEKYGMSGLSWIPTVWHTDGIPENNTIKNNQTKHNEKQQTTI